jgi:hypothetical protein
VSLWKASSYVISTRLRFLTIRPLDVDRAAIVSDRLSGMSLTVVAKKHRVSRATVCRLVNESGRRKKTGMAQDGNQARVIAHVEGSNSQVAA